MADPSAWQEILSSIYAEADPSRRLAELDPLYAAAAGTAASAGSAAAQIEPLDLGKRFLGASTTELVATSQLEMDVIPTAIYNLLAPEDQALVRVSLQNTSQNVRPRRVCVRSWIEALSAEAIRTVEIKRNEQVSIPLLPALLPERSQYITEVRRATVHVRVEDLDGPVECHDTYSVTCLSRNSSFNRVRRPSSGERVDLSHYYGAWVTPHGEAVQERIRHAAQYAPGGQIFGYQKRSSEEVDKQVAALYRSLADAQIAYVSSIIDFGGGEAMSTQRTRLPRESLALKSANCIDGAVLFASLLEGSALEAGLVLVPGHAFVGWQAARSDDAPWHYLETTLIGVKSFEEACDSGKQQAAFHESKGMLTRHALRALRARGIWPME